jgi:hypothetical protein
MKHTYSTNAFRIAVVGSKPKVSALDFENYDQVYYANASITRRHLFPTAITELIISSSIFIDNKSAIIDTARDLILSHLDLTVKVRIVGVAKNSNAKKYLNDYRLLSHRDVLKLIVIKTGWLKLGKYIIKSFSTYTMLRIIYKTLTKGIHDCIKPSTGLVAVLISESERKCKSIPIDVIGIGLTSDGYQYICGVHLRGHEDFDKFLINILSKENVYFHDVELSPISETQN